LDYPTVKLSDSQTVRNEKPRTTIRHLYLPDRSTGLWNAAAVKTHGEIILVDSVIDALSVMMAGHRNVIAQAEHLPGPPLDAQGDRRVVRGLLTEQVHHDLPPIAACPALSSVVSSNAWRERRSSSATSPKMKPGQACGNVFVPVLQTAQISVLVQLDPALILQQQAVHVQGSMDVQNQ
jgi:hypothetical protein